MINLEFNDSKKMAEAKINNLLHPSEYLAQSECEVDAVYWGAGRSIGEIAICKSKSSDKDVTFEGLRNKLGEDFLFCENHYDVDEMFGTFTPFVKIDFIHNNMDTEQEMIYLLDKTIEVQELKLDWLECAPKDLRAGTQLFIEEVGEYLESLRSLKFDGFSKEQTITFKKIFEDAIKNS